MEMGSSKESSSQYSWSCTPDSQALPSTSTACPWSIYPATQNAPSIESSPPSSSPASAGGTTASTDWSTW